MNTMLSLIFAALVGFTMASEVLEATSSDFKKIIESSPFVMVKFYAPWCGHCKNMAPAWEEAATMMKGKAIFVKVDATKETGLASEYGVRGFPTIKYFRNGELAGPYESGRDAASLANFVRTNSGPAVTKVESENELQSLKEEYPLVIVMYGTAHETIFEEIAADMRSQAKFVSAPKSMQPSSKSEVLLYKQHEEGVVDIDDATLQSFDKLKKFIYRNNVKLVDEIGPENIMNYQNIDLLMGWLFRGEKDDTYLELLNDLAKKYYDDVVFVWINSDKYDGIASRLGLSGKVFPSFALDKKMKEHYAYEEGAELTKENLVAFIDGVLAGKIPRTIRSEELPDVETTNGLTTVVGKTFDKLVMEADVDLFIEFFAEWCGHCKKFAPVYESLAKQYESDPTIRIAKMDATLNDFDAELLPVEGFPTLYFLPKGSKTPIRYEGDREKSSLEQFIEKHKSKTAGNDEL